MENLSIDAFKEVELRRMATRIWVTQKTGRKSYQITNTFNGSAKLMSLKEIVLYRRWVQGWHWWRCYFGERKFITYLVYVLFEGDAPFILILWKSQGPGEVQVCWRMLCGITMHGEKLESGRKRKE
jgi:hypothetical protein